MSAPAAVIVLSLTVWFTGDALRMAPQSATQKPTYPPAVPLPLALTDGLAHVEVVPLGGSSGDTMVLRVRRAVPRPVRVSVPAGLVLRSATATVQNMVVAALKGELKSLAEPLYRPASTIDLSDDEVRLYLLEAYCLDFDKANPGTNDLFSVSEEIDATFVAVLKTGGAGKSRPNVIQATLWLVQGVSKEEVRKRFDLTDRELILAEIDAVLVGIKR